MVDKNRRSIPRMGVHRAFLEGTSILSKPQKLVHSKRLSHPYSTFPLKPFHPPRRPHGPRVEDPCLALVIWGEVIAFWQNGAPHSYVPYITSMQTPEKLVGHHLFSTQSSRFMTKANHHPSMTVNFGVTCRTVLRGGPPLARKRPTFGSSSGQRINGKRT